MTLVITTPAADRTLVTLDEAKAYLGISGTSDDAALTLLIARLSDAISRECRVVAPGAAVPSLRSETLTETFRGGCRGSELLLSRRFVTAITSVVEDGETLSASDYEVNGGAGLLSRLEGDDFASWLSGKIVVVYVAGFATVPNDLKQACLLAVWEQWSARNREPLLKREKVDGVGEMEFFYTREGPLFSGEVSTLLAPYVTSRCG